MKIYDITQEVFGGKVYPGDPAPAFEKVLRISKGDKCNLTSLSMCAHNATHLDAPNHFYEKGRTIEQVELSQCIGPSTVAELSEKTTEEELKLLLAGCQKRLLFKGNTVITLEMAKLFNQYNIELLGIEPQSVGPEPVHLELLGNEVVLLEGLVLDNVSTGDYFLCAAPIKLGGSDGAPCRAVLLEFD